MSHLIEDWAKDLDSSLPVESWMRDEVKEEIQRGFSKPGWNSTRGF